jgi:hypothetical protein
MKLLGAPLPAIVDLVPTKLKISHYLFPEMLFNLCSAQRHAWVLPGDDGVGGAMMGHGWIEP